MLMHADRACLLVIDIQERLMPAIHDGESVIANSAWLIQIADRLGIPLLASEQYPKGLGRTVPALRDLLPPHSFMEKTHFSCTEESLCRERLDASGRDQFILVGAEAHVCVLQTALGLLQRGKDVYLVADGTSSRRPEDKALAIERMRAAGVGVVSREMAAFEWLGQAGTELFRSISRDFLK